MWNQWPQYAAAPPLPTTAPPPPPQEPVGVTTAVAPAIIGPMLQTAAVAGPMPAAALPTVASATTASAAVPSALGSNPYSQYTAAQYAAMTPEQQFALQQHWQQWQKYQEEYARWHAQYGEQYKREMELAQKTTTAEAAAPAASAPSAYASSYYQQPPPTAPSSKITGQPQLYTQPPPQAPLQTPDTSAAKQQPPLWHPPTFNQPPPNFGQQNFNANSANNNQFGGNQPQGGSGGQPADNSQFNNRNRGGNNWQASQGNRGPDNFNNRPGNRNAPNSRANDNWNNNEGSKQNFAPNSSTSNAFNAGNAPTMEKSNDENVPANNEESLNSGRNEWNERQNYAGDSNQGPNNWNESSNERNRNFNNNRTQNNWNDGPNNRGNNNGPKNFNDNQGNRGTNERNFGGNNRGPNNRNQGPNNRGGNNWNDGPNNRGNNNWTDSPNNRANNNWNEGSFNRGPNNWNDGDNNRGPNNRNEGPNNRNNASNNWGDRNFGQNNRGPNNWNECSDSNAPTDRGNNDWNDRDRRRSDNWDNNGPNNRGAPNQRGSGGSLGSSGPSGPGNRGRITDMDEEMFDRQFRQWEQQFEDWKKANANHPDREMYRRYEQEFEKQRKRIAERREQMRRRKLEQMGLDPNQPPPESLQPVVDCAQDDKTGNENLEKPDVSGRKRNDSIGSQQSSHSKQNQELTKAQAVLPEAPIQQDVLRAETTQDNKNTGEDVKSTLENSNAAAVVETSKQKSSATPLGKRKTRFDTPVPAAKIKPVEESEVITLDDDDGDADVQELEDKQGKMSEIFKKVDGIPGLDLTDDNSSKEVGSVQPAAKPDQNTSPPNAKKIPSLFDIKVDKPDMAETSVANEQTVPPAGPTSTNLPDLAKTLNDPDFLKRISEAVAHAKGSDTSKGQDADNHQLSFTEWQQRKQDESTENNPHDSNADLDNANSIESFRDRSSNRSEPGDDTNFGGNRGGRGFPNNMGPNNNFGLNNGNNWGPNNNNNNWGQNNNGPNNWGRNGPNNAWGPNGPNGPNNWGPNGPNNNNFGPNGQNNWGPNGPNNGPNNWDSNVNNNNNFGPNGPNNWGPNGNNNWGPNGPNNNFGPNGPNNWGPNGPSGSNNFGPNNFRGGNNFGSGRNFGGNGPNDGPGRNFGGNGPNDGPGRNFGRNDGPGRNFGRNGNNFGRNNDGNGRNFGGDKGSNDGCDDNFSRRRSDGNRNRNSRGDSNDRHGGSDKRSNSSNSGRDRSNNQTNATADAPKPEETATPNRNINNPFRRNDVPVVGSTAANSQGQTEGWNKGPDDNLDYGEYYRPVQVIDYANSSTATPATTTITPKVIDYGHKPVMNDDNSSAFKPLKIINYDHASKAQNPQPQARFLSAAQKRKNRKNSKNFALQQQQTNQQQNKQNRKQKRQQQNQKQLSQNLSAAKKEAAPEQFNVAADCEKGVKVQDELEEISDVEDMPEEPASPPPPPPPMFNTSGTFTPLSIPNNAHSSIFPSTSEANENLPKISSSHVQMSIPTEENNNTISIDEILMKPGRQTRPKKICMILRGPPGSGKSHVARLIKEKEKEMGGNNPRILSIDDYFIVENDYEEKCPKTGKKIPKKELLYEYDKDMEEKYLEYLIKAFKKSVADNFYDFIVIDCNNNSLRSLNEFYCHSKDSGFVPYIIDLFCDLETCLERNIHARSEKEIKGIIDTWKPTPGHYIKLDISSLLQNIVEMEDADDMVVEDNTISDTIANDDGRSTFNENKAEDRDNEVGEVIDISEMDTKDENDEDDSTDSTANFGLFLKSKWETDTTTENLARLDGTSKLSTKRKPTMEEYLQMDEWVPPTDIKGKKRVRWADIEEKRNQEKMRAVGFVVGQTDWKRMMDPNAANRALNKTKYIERVNKRR